jgi:hypothetical protein
MLNKIINSLSVRSWQEEFSINEWLLFLQSFAQINIAERLSLIKVLARHSGISSHLLQKCFTDAPDSNQYEHIAIVQELQKNEKAATTKISTLLNLAYFKQIDLTPLAISRGEWNQIIHLFEQQQRHKVNTIFILSTLSRIRHIPQDTLTNILIQKKQPERKGTKRNYNDTGIEDSNSNIKKQIIFFKKDQGNNPLILKSHAQTPAIEEQLELTGVRTTALTPATPNKHPQGMMRTPGKTLTRPVCTIKGYTLFKHLTPSSTKPMADKENISPVSAETMKEVLPRLRFEQAVEVEFYATLEAINQRAGIARRQSQNALMGASASDVFRAHGIEITSTNGRSYHWSHLIAHFLADNEEISSCSPEQEAINLVPATAAANYNILEAIELFIKKKLIEKETDQIKIKANPQFNGDALIPDMLIYTLNWNELNSENNIVSCEEQFNISLQSHQRFTKSMHLSFTSLRQTQTQLLQDMPEFEEESESPMALIPKI